jgi:hypothetical protein
MLEQRVARLEDALKGIETALVEIRADLKHGAKASDITGLRSDFGGLRGDYANLKADVAELRGRMSQMPTLLQLVVTVITTWSAGAAIVFTLLRVAR